MRRFAGLAPLLIFAAAFGFAVAALIVVTLNGGRIGSADATGSAILAVSFSAVGAVIVVRRPGNLIGWILLLGGLCNGLNAFSWQYARYALLTSAGSWPFGPFFAWLSTWIFAPGFVASFPLTLLLFPTGRPSTPRWRPLLWLIVAGLALAALPMAAVAWPLRGTDLVTGYLWNGEVTGELVVVLQRTGVGIILLCILASVVSIGFRYRRAAGEERQQLKWLVYAGALTFAVTLTASPAAFFELPGFAGELLSILATLALPSIPVAVGIAILKHRLYDIDIVINRTLVYGSLTVALVLIYAGTVTTLQYAFRALTAGDSQLVVVASTLAIAALFNPLRRRIQSFIDRRFYRRKYDAAKTLEAFGLRLRDEVDLEHLVGEFVAVVERTVQPAHTSLWLRGLTAEPRRPEPGEGREGR